MKRAISVILCFALTLLLCGCLTGCGETAAQVYYLNFKPETAKIFDNIAKDYKQETGVELKVVTAAANTYEQTLKSEIAKKNAPTIFQINGPIGFGEWRDYCADLKDTKLYDILSDKNLAIIENGGVYGIPYVVEGYGIIYNSAVTDKYFSLTNRQKTVNSMAEINNFESFKTVVEDMSKHLTELGIDGVFASTSLLSGEDWRWQTHLLNIPLYYEFKENENYDDPTIAGINTTDIKFKYSDNYKMMFDLYINNSVTPKTLLGAKSVADSMAEFALGKAAMVQNGNWAWSQISDVSGNTVKESDIKFLPIYVGIDGEENQGLCIGTENYLAINSKATNESQKLAKDFLEWLFTSEKGKKYVTEELKYITPFTSFTTDEQPSDPLAREISKYLNDDTKISVPWIFTSFPSENFKISVGNMLLEYAQGSLDYNELKTRLIGYWKSER